MRALVTGVSGFIGSALAGRLDDIGWSVRGIDRRPLPPPDQSAGKLAVDGFVEDDLLTCDLDRLLVDVDVVFHLAARTGVRGSWSTDFPLYIRDNVEATHRLLEAVRRHPVHRFVYASSSSVYGNSLPSPSIEGVTVERPHSPYGVSKLAAEGLCGVFSANFDVPLVALRYFTVYGPGQRADMAISRMIGSALGGYPFPLFGSAEQIRDFTFVGDTVDATIAAATTPLPRGTVLNIASGTPVALRTVLDHIADITGASVPVEHRPAEPGDVDRTAADASLARELLRWSAAVALPDGLADQVDAARRQSAPLTSGARRIGPRRS